MKLQLAQSNLTIAHANNTLILKVVKNKIVTAFSVDTDNLVLIMGFNRGKLC